VSPAECRRIGHVTAARRLGNRFAADQGPRLVVPAIHVAQTSQRRPGQRIECLAAACAAVARLAVGLAPPANGIAAAVRAAKVGDPGPPDLRHHISTRSGIDGTLGPRWRGFGRNLQWAPGGLWVRQVNWIIRFGESQVLQHRTPLAPVQSINPDTPHRKCCRVHLPPFASADRHCHPAQQSTR